MTRLTNTLRIRIATSSHDTCPRVQQPVIRVVLTDDELRVFSLTTIDVVNLRTGR
jgi:hypothetical protein